MQFNMLAAFTVLDLGVFWFGGVLQVLHDRGAEWLAPYAYITLAFALVAPVVAWAAPWPFHTPPRRLLVGAAPIVWTLGLICLPLIMAGLSRTP